MLPDLTHLLGLDQRYGPHNSKEFRQTSVTPGTVDPPIPSHISQDDGPDVAELDKKQDSHRQLDYLLDCLFDAIHYPGYEMYGPITVGGKSQTSLSQIANVTGTGSIYTIGNPFDSDAEWCPMAASFGAAGQAVLSNDPSNIGPSLAQFYDSSSIVRVIPYVAAGVATITYGSDYWFPIEASDSLYWAVNMTAANTSAAWITVAFRRRLDRHGRYLLTVR